MENNPMIEIKNFWSQTLTNYVQNPWNIIALIIDILIVVFLLVKIIKVLKGSRAMQLVKGIIFLLLITWLSSVFKLKILNYLLTTIMTYLNELRIPIFIGESPAV